MGVKERAGKPMQLAGLAGVNVTVPPIELEPATSTMEISYEQVSRPESAFLAYQLQVNSARGVPAPTLSLMAAEQDIDEVNAHVPHLHNRRPGSQRDHQSSSGSTEVGREQT